MSTREPAVRKTTGKRIALLALAAMSLASAIAPAVAQASFPGGNGLVVFTSNRDGDNEIFSMTPSGTAVTQLTSNAASDQDPELSADGTKIVFTSNRDGDNEIFTMNLDGSGQTQLTSNTAVDQDPAFSPSGSQIAFRTDRDGNNEIYSMTSAGGSQTNLTSNAFSDFNPDWSPDGSTIVFQRFDGTIGNEIFTMTSAGASQTRLTNNAVSANDGQPSWSPDGSSIAFHSNRDGDFEIFTMTPAGASQTQRTANTNLDQKPVWSPNGQRFAFFSDRDGSNEIYTATAPAAGSQTRVTNNAANDQTPAWANDSVAPDTTIDTGQADGSFTNDNTPTFTFTSSEANSTFECQVNGGGFSACTSPFTPAALPEGSNTVQVRALDVAANPDPTPASRTFTVDTVAPTASITANPPDPSNSANASFSFDSNESPNVTFKCKLDAGPFEACASPYGYTGLTDGSHTFQVRATDQADNTGTPAEYTWTVDLVPPETSLDDVPGDPTNSSTADFVFSSPSPDVGFYECSLDGAAFSTCTSPKQYTGLADGTHTFDVRAVDTAGNPDPTPEHFEWLVDSDAPETTIDSGPDPITLATTATFTFSSDESPVTFECQLDFGGYTPCSSGQEYTGLLQGNHTFEVRATDESGNTDPIPADQEWTVVTDQPDTVIDTFPPDPSNDTTVDFTFHGTIPGTNSFECSLGGGPFTSCSSPSEVEILFDTTTTFEVRSIDMFGRVDATPASYTWTTDLTKPNTTFSATPPESSPTGDVTHEFAADESSTFECSVDDGPFTLCTSPYSQTGLTDGVHKLEVRATDDAGNVEDTPAEDTFRVDTIDPDTAIDSGPSDPSNTADPSFEFSSNESPDVTFECQIDGGGYSECDSPQAYTGLSEGSHTFDVRAIDLAGNTDPSPASQSWTVDTIAPAVDVTSAPTGTIATDEADIEFTVDDNTATVECSLDGDPYAACSSPVALTGLADGPHTLTVRATDAANNVGSDAANFTVDTTEPDTTIDSQPAALSNSAGASFEFSSNEAGGTFECQLDGGGFSLCTSPQAYAGLSDGSHTFDVRAIDAVGNVDPSPASYTWEVDTTPPDTAIDATPPNPSNTHTGVFEFSSADPDAASFECKIDGNTFEACTSPRTYLGLADGSHTFSVRAVDGANNPDPTPASYTWVIDTTGPVTTIDARPNDPTNSSGATYEFSSNEPGSTFECRLDSTNPADYAPCTSPQAYAGLAEGTHTFDVRATDTLGNTGAPDSDTFRVDLTEPNTTINSGPPAQSISKTANLTFSSSEPNSDFECSLDGGAFGSCSSPKQYTNLADGSHTFEVRAVDEAGNTDSSPASRTWNVDTTPPTVGITSGPSGSTSSNAASFGFNVAGATTIECKLDGGAFAACTSPQAYSALGNGQHTFTVRATDAAGNTAADSRTWTVDASPPDTTITSSPASGLTATSASFEFVATEPGSTFECALDAGAFASCTSPKAYSGLAPGAHTFRVRATDAGGATDTSPAVHNWTINSVPDLPPPPSPPTVTLAKSSKLKGAKATVGTVGCPAGATCAGGERTASLKAGGATFSARVSVSAAGKITVKLSKAARAALAEAGKGRLSVSVTVTASNGTQASAARKVKLRSPKP